MCQKLASWGFDETCTEAVIHRLKSLGYLSDAKFYHRLAEKKARSGFGPDMVRAMLLEQENVDEALVEAAIAQVSEELWHAGFVAKLTKRFGVSVLGEEHEKVLHYFMSRGYDVEYIEKRIAEKGVGCGQ